MVAARLGRNGFDGLLDELQISNVIRYRQDFEMPRSFSRSYGAQASKASVPTGPPLLFGPNAPKRPVHLGSHKYLFIDDALRETQQGLTVRLNPPVRIGATNIEVHGEKSVYDNNGKICMAVTDGYGSEKGGCF